MSLHPHELDKIDWAILVTFLYIQLELPMNIQYGGLEFMVFGPINSILYDGVPLDGLKDELNCMVKLINHTLKEKPQIRKELKETKVTFNKKPWGPYGKDSTFSVDAIGFGYSSDYYQFRNFPMKEKFKKFFKETKWEYETKV